MLTSVKNKLRRLLAMVISTLLVISVVVPVEAKAQESPYDPITHLDEAYAYGYGGLLDLRLLHKFLTIGKDGRALTAAELRGVDQLWKTAVNNDQAAKTSNIDLGALELIYLNLGAISLPLVGEGGLLELVLNDASVGVLREYAHTPSATAAHGAAGVVSDSGGLEITQPGSGKNASINLLSLLNLRGSTLITENIISAAALELGAVSAVATKPDTSALGGNVQPTCDPNLTLFEYNKLDIGDLIGDPDVLVEEDERICSGYQIADAQIVVDAPAVGTLVGTLQTTLGTLLEGVESTLNGLLGSESVLDAIYSIPLVGTLLKGVVNITVEVDVPATDITAALLTDPLEDSTGLVSIDLSTGKISVDLKQLHGGNLNGLEPNTSLLTPAELTQITDTVTNLLTASKEVEPDGLNGRLEKILKGEGTEENQRGGLYATEVKIESCVLGLLGSCTLEADITATLGGLLTGAEEGSQSDYDADPYGYYYVSGVLGLTLTSVLGLLLEGLGGIVNNLIFGEGTGLLGGLLGDLQTQVVSPLLTTLTPVLEGVLDPIANIIINRQTLQEVEHGTVFTVSALEVNVLDLNTSGEVIHLPLATASVMAQHWELIDLDLNVAKIGDGRNLHTGGYTYGLVCEANNWNGIDEKSLAYDKLKVGTGFAYVDNQLSLMDASGGLEEPVRVLPGATCTVTATPPLEAEDALRPTGDTPTRTPYTYFLDTDESDVVVSGETPENEPTTLSPDGVTVDAVQVTVAATDVGDEWKNHSFTFVVPEDADSHLVNIVHAYDIDTRDIDLTKTITGVAPEGDPFAVEYSLDGGTTWLPQAPDAALSLVPGGAPVTIQDVPVLDLAQLNASSPTEVNTEIKIREALGSNADAQSVTWTLDTNPLTGTYISDGTVQYAIATFEAGPVVDATVVPTPKINVGVTNSYLEVGVDKHIDGLLDGIGATTLLPFGEDEMTIRYTVTTTEDPASVTLSDPSLIKGLFDLPPDLSVDPATGNIFGCVLTSVSGQEDTYSCEFTVTFTDPEAPFHYEAETATVTATVTKTDGERTLSATDTDNHGAMRLSDLAAMLPNTGATTLVWVLGLGLLVALAALVNYIRSRRN